MSAWFDDPRVQDAVTGRLYGVVLYHARLAAGLSQAEAAARLGVSKGTISRWESGQLRMADIDTLRRVSRTLNIPPRLLGLSDDAPSTGMVGAATDVDTTEVVRAMLRRHVLVGLAASASVLPALRASASPLASQLDAAVFTPPGPLPPQPLPQLTRTVAQMRKHFDACRWRALAAHLPDLVALAQTSRDEAAHGQRAAFDAVLAQVYVLGNELAIKLHETPAAWVMAERAMAAARASGDPRVTARARWRTAVSLRRAGHRDTASQVATGAAQELARDTGLQTPADAGFHARLLCCAAYTEALADHRANAYDLLNQARESVAEHPYSTFGFDEVAGYGISVARGVGDYGAAVQFAAQVRVDALDTLERRTRFYEDTAIAWWSKGHAANTYQALRAAERVAPEEVKFRPWAHRLTVNLLSCPRGTTGLDGLREFAGRIGVGTGG